MRMLNLGCGNRHHPDWINVDIRSSAPDVLEYDLTKGLPFADGTFDVVYHSHLLEHLPRPQALPFLCECHRVLKPGGVLRVVVPDLESVARAYLQLLDEAAAGDAAAKEKYEWIVVELLDQLARHVSGGEMLRYWQRNPLPAESYVYERVGSEARLSIASLRSGRARVPDASNLDPAKVGAFRLSGECHQWMYDRYSLASLMQAAGFGSISTCGADESRIPGFNGYRLDIEAFGATRKPDSLFMEALR